jgi:hypothetical protein
MAMPANAPTSARNLDGYDAPIIPWARVQDSMDGELTQAPETGGPDRHTSWLATTNADGTPHVMPLGAMRVDGTWYFSSGLGTRKSRNLVRDPRCVLTVATRPFDLVIEGTAEVVTDETELQAVAESYNEGGWPARAEGGALTAPFSAPAAGPPPWHVFRITPATVFALGTAEPYGATRFDLDSGAAS